MTDDLYGEIYVEPPFQAVILPPQPTILEPEPALPAPEPTDPEPEPAPSGDVVSVAELLDMLSQAGQDTEETPAVFDEDADAGDEMPVYFDYDTSIAIEGMEELLQHLETLEQIAVHPMMETPFEAYTVTEGLLLLIFVILFLDFFLNLLRRWF